MIRIAARLSWTNLFLFMCCLTVSHAADVSPATYSGPKEKLHVYAVAGEMCSAEAMLDEKSPVIERCYVLTEGGKRQPARIQPARMPSVRNPGKEEEGGDAGAALACGFAKTMLEKNKDISIGLFFVNAPGTRIEEWHRKSEYFRQLRGGLFGAQSKGEVKGVLWRHSASLTNSTLDKMMDLFGYLRGAIGLNIPIVVGELPGSEAMNAPFATLASKVHALKVAGVEGLTTDDGKKLKDGGLQILGERYAGQMLKIQEEWAAKGKFRPRGEIPCMDTHIHSAYNQENGLDGVDKWMKKNHVVGCVDHALRPMENEKQRQYMRANYAKHKGRILRFTYIEPADVSSVEEAVKILEKEKADYAVGFGEHYGRGLMFDDPKNLRLYEACEKVGFPVMFHIDANKNMVEKGMRRVERVLEMFPKCILIAHAAWWEGLPDGTCDRMLQKYPNLYADTSGGQMLALFNRDRGYTRELFIRNAGKILYGSDEGWWSLADAEHPSLFFQLCDELDLPEDVKAKIFRDNAMKLFGLKGK